MPEPLQFRKRPLVVHAMQLTGDSTMALIDWLRADRYLIDDQAGMPALWIKSLEGGRRRVHLGDWVVSEGNELHVYGAAGFDRLYELEAALATSPPLTDLIEEVGEWCGTDGCSGTPRDAEVVAAAVLAGGWRPPARVIETAEALADEPTGTVLRSRHGDIASVDHGPHGDWLGTGTQVHFLGPGTSGWLTVGDLIDPDMAGSLPWTVLWQPEVNR